MVLWRSFSNARETAVCGLVAPRRSPAKENRNMSFTNAILLPPSARRTALALVAAVMGIACSDSSAPSSPSGTGGAPTTSTSTTTTGSMSTSMATTGPGTSSTMGTGGAGGSAGAGGATTGGAGTAGSGGAGGSVSNPMAKLVVPLDASKGELTEGMTARAGKAY